MSLRYYANAPATTLSASINGTTTAVPVVSVAGFPIQYPYTLILDRGTASEEAVSVTAASGLTLTVTRSIDGTTAFSHSIGAVVEHGITAQDVREPNTHVNANAGVHGVTGSVVGTSDAQALSNKTLGSTNTLNGFAASKMAVTDGSGKLVAGTSAPPAGAVVGTSDSQALTNKDLTSATNTFPTTLVTTTTSQAVTNKDLSSTTNALPPYVNPIGSVTLFAGASAPSGHVLCDGRALSRTTYATLFGIISTTYGSGDGSSTFNVPDLSGRVAIGVGTATGAAGATAHTLTQKGGEETHTLSVTEMPTHSHKIPGYVGGPSGSGWNWAGDGSTFTQDARSTGGDAAHNNMQPYLTMNYIIRVL